MTATENYFAYRRRRDDAFQRIKENLARRLGASPDMVLDSVAKAEELLIEQIRHAFMSATPTITFPAAEAAWKAEEQAVTAEYESWFAPADGYGVVMTEKMKEALAAFEKDKENEFLKASAISLQGMGIYGRIALSGFWGKYPLEWFLNPPKKDGSP